MDKKLREMLVPELVDMAASDAPAPGGGAVSALVASLSAALGQMVLALSYGKKCYKKLDTEVQEKLKEEDAELEKLRSRLLELMDNDTDAFLGYMDAFSLPKSNDEEKAARREAIDNAALYAMQVPLETAERCVNVLNCLPAIAQNGNKNAITDVGVSALLARAGCEGALLNVKINLPTIKDETIRDKAAKRSEELLAEADKICADVMQEVHSKL